MLPQDFNALSQELYALVVDFVNDKIAIRNLEEWAISHTEEIARTPDSIDANMLAAIDLALAEYDNGIRDLSSVKDYLTEALLAAKASYAVVGADQVNVIISTSKSASTYRELRSIHQQINYVDCVQVKM